VSDAAQTPACPRRVNTQAVRVLDLAQRRAHMSHLPTDALA
jgi:hypothetical protein